eukprot:Anaeramoba_ignava/c19909_g1_i1.p1 GENE.c19909_g1_i1~~c19909_g1_i1.p1  ORF type:complete len:291 (-),score=105.27 c19909_g1_i1:50-922(-)
MDQKKVEEFQNLIQNLMLKIQLQNITIRQIEEMKKLKFFDEIPQQIQFNINLLAKKNKQDQEIEKLQQETEKVKKKIIKTVNQENQEKPKKPKKPKTKDEPKKEDLGPFVGSSIITKKIYAQYLKAWLKDDSFFNHLQICFSAAKDGFDCKIFHQKCDDRKKTLVLIKTTENFIFGGYTSVGWQKGSNKKKIWDADAFIFSLKNPKNLKPTKFPISKRREMHAVYYGTQFGPIFGGNDIYIYGNLKGGHTDFGFSYALPHGIEYSSQDALEFFAGSYKMWKIEELEVYCL